MIILMNKYYVRSFCVSRNSGRFHVPLPIVGTIRRKCLIKQLKKKNKENDLRI